jgi:hypothetical protein
LRNKIQGKKGDRQLFKKKVACPLFSVPLKPEIIALHKTGSFCFALPFYFFCFDFLRGKDYSIGHKENRCLKNWK